MAYFRLIEVHRKLLSQPLFPNRTTDKYARACFFFSCARPAIGFLFVQASVSARDEAALEAARTKAAKSIGQPGFQSNLKRWSPREEKP